MEGTCKRTIGVIGGKAGSRTLFRTAGLKMVFVTSSVADDGAVSAGAGVEDLGVAGLDICSVCFVG
jgi:hypothetical protein